MRNFLCNIYKTKKLYELAPPSWSYSWRCCIQVASIEVSKERSVFYCVLIPKQGKRHRIYFAWAVSAGERHTTQCGLKKAHGHQNFLKKVVWMWVSKHWRGSCLTGNADKCVNKQTTYLLTNSVSKKYLRVISNARNHLKHFRANKRAVK